MTATLLLFLLLVSQALLFSSSSPSPSSSSSSIHAVSKWKAPNSSTPAELKQQWQDDDAALFAYIASSVPAVLQHTGSEAFDEHLRGVQSILRYWSAPSYLYNAGLFHSIYGTEGFQGYSLPLTERGKIRDLIGEKAERMCWIFCMVDRSTVDKTVLEYNTNINNKNDNIREPEERTIFTFLSRPELGRFVIELSKNEWLDFIELTLADWLEQVQGAAEKPSTLFCWNFGEAYAYRRTAYAKMVDILTHERRDRLENVVRTMFEDIYSTEGNATRHLVQPRTPSMSDMAKLALDALRSAGEDIPVDCAPQPMLLLSREDDNTCKSNEATQAENGNELYYEKDDLLSMYLGLHFPRSGTRENVRPIMDHEDAPIHGLRFPQRAAELLVSLNPQRTNGRVLDIGCAVGGSSFELAKNFDHVEAFDFSDKFIQTAKTLQTGGIVKFRVPKEGDLAEDVSVFLEPGVTAQVMQKVHFFRGDACKLSEYALDTEAFGTFDGVLLANLLCRLPNPWECLNALPAIINDDGVVLIITPFSWLQDFTPRDKWLGGYIDSVNGQPVYSKEILKDLMESNGFVKIHEQQMPLVIREHQRKYQYIISEATGWRKK